MIKQTIAYALIIGTIFLVSSPLSQAHTRLQTPQIDENTADHGRDYNNVVIAHGCDGRDTIANITVFPDGIDSTITINGNVSETTLTDHIINWTSPVTIVQSKDIFTKQNYITDDLGHKLGFYSYNGRLTSGFRGLIPFTTNGVVFNQSSCAKTVTFKIAIIDICEITDTAGFTSETVNMWTPAVGSIFDGAVDSSHYDSPATLTVNRTSQLPESCGEGDEVIVTPSAAQLERDMIIELNGVQVWPSQ